MLSALRGHLGLGIRTDAEELLDSGRLSDVDVERNLADLARLNRRLPGGATTSVAAVRRLVGHGSAARVLDVGAGAADIPARFAQEGWSTTAIDRNATVLAVARRRTAGEPAIEIREGDARHLAFGDGSFDVAHCSLLLHHLDPANAIVALSELRRVARIGVVVNDLRRGTWPLLATWATTAVLARSPVTRADGMLSVRRAYTIAELDDLLADAGLRPVWRSAAWMPRVVTAAVAR